MRPLTVLLSILMFALLGAGQTCEESGPIKRAQCDQVELYITGEGAKPELQMTQERALAPSGFADPNTTSENLTCGRVRKPV